MQFQQPTINGADVSINGPWAAPNAPAKAPPLALMAAPAQVPPGPPAAAAWKAPPQQPPPTADPFAGATVAYDWLWTRLDHLNWGPHRVMLYVMADGQRTVRFFPDCESGASTRPHGVWRVEDTDAAGNLLTMRIQVHHSGDQTQLRDHVSHRVNHSSASLVHQQWPDTMIQPFL